jgi:hypothetical protein
VWTEQGPDSKRPHSRDHEQARRTKPAHKHAIARPRERGGERGFDINRQDTDVVIERRHIEMWLATTRRSISREETKGMTTEFVVGRNGDTSDDGSMRACRLLDISILRISNGESAR